MEEAVIDFSCEAQRSLEEVSYAISEGCLSQTLKSTGSCAYFNLTTKEKNKMTVRLSSRGFEVVGHSYDNSDLEKDCEDVGKAYETIYALLLCISPSYQLNFNDAVARKLKPTEQTT